MPPLSTPSSIVINVAFIHRCCHRHYCCHNVIVIMIYHPHDHLRHCHHHDYHLDLHFHFVHHLANTQRNNYLLFLYICFTSLSSNVFCCCCRTEFSTSSRTQHLTPDATRTLSESKSRLENSMITSGTMFKSSKKNTRYSLDAS